MSARQEDCTPAPSDSTRIVGSRLFPSSSKYSGSLVAATIYFKFWRGMLKLFREYYHNRHWENERRRSVIEMQHNDIDDANQI